MPGPVAAPRTQAKEGLDAILSPRSVAVIGASPNPAAIGHALMASILDGGYKGPLYPIHPHAKEVLGHRAYASLMDLPVVVDLAVIAVPADVVLEVAEACGRKGVRGLLVVSAGFRESDAAGGEREETLRAIVARHGMRMVGPNCLGVINNSPSVMLHATFGPRPVLPGTTALVTQSGAVGIALMEHALHVGLGFSRFVSMGNKADVSGNDLLLLWDDDPEVRQILFYLENFGNPRNFVRIAKRITKRKPIVVIKSGRTSKGARAAGSHTGALMQSDALVDALLQQCGVLRAQSTEDLFDIAMVLDTQPPMVGRRVAIVTNSGGPAILAVDALEAAGLEPADLAPVTLARIQPFLPPESHATNPLDLLAGGSPEAFEAALRACLDDSGVDAVLAIWTPLLETQAGQAQAIARALADAKKPGVAVVFGHGPGTPAFEQLRHARVPVFTFPENAVRSLAALRDVASWHSRSEEPAQPLAVDQPRARAILAAAQLMEGGWLAMRDAFALMDAYGIPLPRHAWIDVRDPVDAAKLAAIGIPFPAVLKVEAPRLVHKTEAGAVRLGLSSAQEAARGCLEIVEALRTQGYEPSGAVLMETVAPAPEILVGATQDALFGPVVALGAGGIYTEVLKDVQFRLAPFAHAEARRMLERLRMAPMLAGARGAQPADVASLTDVVVRIARLAADFPEIAEVEANPLRALPTGPVALDVRVRISQPILEQAARAAGHDQVLPR